MKRHPDIAGPVRNIKIGDLFRAKRKPILMAAAAILVALAGLQLGKAFLRRRCRESPVRTRTGSDRRAD